MKLKLIILTLYLTGMGLSHSPKVGAEPTSPTQPTNTENSQSLPWQIVYFASIAFLRIMNFCKFLSRFIFFISFSEIIFSIDHNVAWANEYSNHKYIIESSIYSQKEGNG